MSTVPSEESRAFNLQALQMLNERAGALSALIGQSIDREIDMSDEDGNRLCDDLFAQQYLTNLQITSHLVSTLGSVLAMMSRLGSLCMPAQDAAEAIREFREQEQRARDNMALMQQLIEGATAAKVPVE